MHSCLLAAGVGPGDEVIVPPLTAVSTAVVVVQCGAVPVFADIEPKTYNIDPADIARKITPHTRAIIPVSLYGLPPDYDAIMALAEQHNLTVIEDNAECYLSTYKGRLVGTIGHAASYSFQSSKHMTSGGDGGIVITDDKEYAQNIRKRGGLGFSTLGAKPGDVFVPRDVRQDFEFERHDVMGYHYRMSSVQAALALAQLERLELLVAARIYIAGQYQQVIESEDCDWLIPPVVPEDSTHTYWTYTCKLDEAKAGVNWREFRKTFIEHGETACTPPGAPCIWNLSFATSPSTAAPIRPPTSIPLPGNHKKLPTRRLPHLRSSPALLMSIQNKYANARPCARTSRSPAQDHSPLFILLIRAKG